VLSTTSPHLTSPHLPTNPRVLSQMAVYGTHPFHYPCFLPLTSDRRITNIMSANLCQRDVTCTKSAQRPSGNPEHRYRNGAKDTTADTAQRGSCQISPTPTLLYYFDQVFTSRVTTKKNYFFIFALNQKKIYRPSRPIFFPKA
jgi:hypothetical protein